MRTLLRGAPLLAFAVLGCGRSSANSTPSPVAFALPDSVELIDGATGQRVPTVDLTRRIGAADLVLLGEFHDDAVHHRIRGQLITAFAARHPAIVFEQFAETEGPIAAPAKGESETDWLDRNGFDRTGWRWPLHRPVVDAALAHARAIWGSGLSSQSLRAVVRGGVEAAPEPLRALIQRTPLDSLARAEVDRELVEGHCGQLPAQMIPGMRAAQEARDASMTRALLSAAASGPAWLIAGNGHVNGDMGVPRMLRIVAPEHRMLVVGFLERDEHGDLPTTAERRPFDLVVVTPRVEREDPCAAFKRRS